LFQIQETIYSRSSETLNTNHESNIAESHEFRASLHFIDAVMGIQQLQFSS